MAAPKQSSTTPVLVLRPTSEPSTFVMALRGSIARGDIPLLCERARMLLEGSTAEIVVCDVEGLRDPDVVAVDALARLWLTARRRGYQVRLDRVSSELQELLTLVGLCDVLRRYERSLPLERINTALLPLRGGALVEFGRQAEQWKEARRIEEETDPGDGPV